MHNSTAILPTGTPRYGVEVRGWRINDDSSATMWSCLCVGPPFLGVSPGQDPAAQNPGPAGGAALLLQGLPRATAAQIARLPHATVQAACESAAVASHASRSAIGTAVQHVSRLQEATAHEALLDALQARTASGDAVGCVTEELDERAMAWQGVRATVALPVGKSIVKLLCVPLIRSSLLMNSRSGWKDILLYKYRIFIKRVKTSRATLASDLGRVPFRHLVDNLPLQRFVTDLFTICQRGALFCPSLYLLYHSQYTVPRAALLLPLVLHLRSTCWIAT